jgi:hypothetical protein
MSRLLCAQETAFAIVEMFEGAVSNAEVPPDTEWAEYAACLTLTTFEQYHAALHLIDGKLASHAAGPVRSMLEGVADLLNLCADPVYMQAMRYSNARENVALFDELKKSSNVPEDMAKTLAEWDARDRLIRDELRQELKKRGDHELKLADKLKRVELTDIYATYRMLCALVHPSLTSLKARHRTGANVVEYRAKTSPALIIMFYRIAIDLLCRCMSETYKFTNLRQKDVDCDVA